MLDFSPEYELFFATYHLASKQINLRPAFLLLKKVKDRIAKHIHPECFRSNHRKPKIKREQKKEQCKNCRHASNCNDCFLRRKIVRNSYRRVWFINQVGHQNPLKPGSAIHATSPAGGRGSRTRRCGFGFWSGSSKYTEFLLQPVRPACGARNAWPIVRRNKHVMILFAVTAIKFVDRHLLIFCVFSFPSTPCPE